MFGVNSESYNSDEGYIIHGNTGSFTVLGVLNRYSSNGVLSFIFNIECDGRLEDISFRDDKLSSVGSVGFSYGDSGFNVCEGFDIIIGAFLVI